MVQTDKKRNKWPLALLILLIAAGGGYWGFKKLKHQEHRAEAAANTAVITMGNIESVVTAQGKLEPKEYVDVGAQVSGQIDKMHVEIGDEVKTGDLIAEIDPDIYQSKVDADAARLKTLLAQKAEQEALVKQAQLKLTRNKKLIDSKAISPDAYEDTQTNVQVAQAQLANVNAQIEEQQSALDGDKTNLSYTKIYAPMDGTIVVQSIKEGQTINASQTAPVIVQIANLDTMTVRAQVAEADVSKLKADMDVYFTTMGSQDRKWEGKIRQILPSPETVNDVVLYDVLVDVQNTDHSLMTGMTTQMFFVQGSAQNVALIPASALTKRAPEEDTAQGQAYKISVMENGRPAEKTVLTGLSDRTQVQIISGLNPGDKIILSMPQSTSTTPAQGQGAGGKGGMRGMPRL